MSDYQILTATPDDIPQLAFLINSAFRGEQAKQGWTTEAFLIEGDKRIDEPALQQIMENPKAIIKKCITDANKLVGCVYLERQDTELYLGMLTVAPEIQAQGIGKKLLLDAEDYAAEQNLIAIVMVVVSLRLELINWYLRHGYYLTGETRPFPTENKFGTPREQLEFSVLKKNIILNGAAKIKTY